MPGGRETSLGTQFLVRPGSCREHNPWRGVFCCGHHNKREEGGLERFSHACPSAIRLTPPTGRRHRHPHYSDISCCVRCPWPGHPSPSRQPNHTPPLPTLPVRSAHARAGVCLNATAIKTREEGGYILPCRAVAPFQETGKYFYLSVW